MKKNLAVNVLVKASVGMSGITVEAVRPVTIIQTSPGSVRGYVGNAHYWWEPKKYSLPMVILDGKRHYGDYICQMVKSFLMAWKEIAIANKKTVVCYEEHDELKAIKESARKATGEASNYVSGHPLWLTNAKKKIRCVVKATGLTYESRRIVPKAMQPLVESHVEPYCHKCAFRAGCEKPCENPAQSCKEDVLNV